jgi:DDE superfamily endonuclease
MASEKEQNVQKALNELLEKKYRSIQQAALANGVASSTLAHRVRGRRSIHNVERKSQRFTNEEEKLLGQWIRDLQRQRISPNYRKMRIIMQNLLRNKGDLRPLGKHFVTRFVRRHAELKSGFSRALDIKRASALDVDIVKSFFAEFRELKTKYNVEIEDIYNMDETGFQMSQTNSEYVVYNSTEGPSQFTSSENTNWVSIIKCISTRTAIKPYLIFKGNNPETNWFPVKSKLPDFIYGFSNKGWSDDELGIDWLRRIFLSETLNGQKHRILILDNHFSHSTGEFQYLCYQNNVHLLFLPAHSSHKLQSLDMGPFSPLAKRYSEAIHEYTPTGTTTLNRRIFIEIYAQIRPLTLSDRVIRAGWTRTGLQPENEQRILDLSEVKNFGHTTPEYQSPAIPESPNGLLSTPKRFKEFQTIISEITAKSTPTTRRRVEKLSHAVIQEHTAAVLLQNELKQLRDHTVDTERNKRSKRIRKEVNQRSWDLEQIKAAREGPNKLPVPRIVKKGRRKLILALPFKKLD